MTKDPAAVLDSLIVNPQLRGFIRAGRIETMPSKRSRRLQLLAEVAQVFEPGVRYPEPTVNELLLALYPDCAALRRYLVDEEFMDRADGVYWRIGGPVPSLFGLTELRDGDTGHDESHGGDDAER